MGRKGSEVVGSIEVSPAKLVLRVHQSLIGHIESSFQGTPDLLALTTHNDKRMESSHSC
jgi:hypothetical protein